MLLDELYTCRKAAFRTAVNHQFHPAQPCFLITEFTHSAGCFVFDVDFKPLVDCECLLLDVLMSFRPHRFPLVRSCVRVQQAPHFVSDVISFWILLAFWMLRQKTLLSNVMSHLFRLALDALRGIMNSLPSGPIFSGFAKLAMSLLPLSSA